MSLRSPLPSLLPSPRARREDAVSAARWALVGLFAVNGFTLSGWLSRLPALRDALDLTPGELGTVLVTASVGGILTTAIAPATVARWGQGGAVRFYGGLIGLAYVVMGTASVVGSLGLLALGLFLNGIGLAGNNLTINVGSAAAERRLARPILPQFHAAFSVGTVLGSLAGAAAAAVDVPLLAHFLTLALIAVAWRLVAAPALLADPVPVADDGAPAAPAATLRTVLREQRALLIGVLALAGIIAEFAANDWLALAVVDGLAAPESVGAVLLAVLLGAMTVVRLFGTAIITRFGRVATLRGGAVVSILGVVVLVTAPSVPVAALGAAAWGAGVALNFPILVSAASDDPARGAQRIAVLSLFASLAPLVEPASIGLLADHVGVRPALLAVAAVLIVLVVGAKQVAAQRVPARGAAAQDAATPGPVQEPVSC